MALQEELEEDLLKEFVDKEYKINNWDFPVFSKYLAINDFLLANSICKPLI